MRTRRKRGRWLAGGVLVATVGVCVLAGVWALGEAGPEPITTCRTPLVGDVTCRGADGSWIECDWSFHATGRPEPELCRRFLTLPAGHRPRGEPADYDDVRAFAPSDCGAFALPAGLRCFTGSRHESEATNRYLQAFDPACTRGVVLRSCNARLRTYP